jgi:hypothetical protein
LTDENKTTQAPTAEAPQSEAPVKGAPDLTVQDLQALKAIIDVASQRGAYKPNEIEVVGRTYNRLDTFLAAITPKTESADGEAPAPTSAPAQPETAAPAPVAEAPKE